MNRKVILLGSLIILAVIIGFTLEGTAAQKEQPKMGGTLISAVGKEPGNLNPFIATISGCFTMT